MSKMKTGVAAVAVCAAACAGVAALPVVLGGVAAGGALAVLEGEAALVVLLALGGATAYLWLRRPRRADCGCATADGCAPDGTSCHLPDPKKPG